MPARYLKKTGAFFIGVSISLLFLLITPYSPALAAEGLIYASISPDQGFKAPRKDASISLAPGRFLVARGVMRDPFFSKSVVYLVEYNIHGALGIVVNHPTKINISKALPSLDWLKDSPLAISWGGPVEQRRLTILALSGAPLSWATHVSGELYAGWDIELFKDFFLKGSGEITAVRVYGGYAGWAPGQLTAEVERGGWRVVEADEADIFRDTSKLWYRLMGRP